jgi:hypothetical protein
MLSNLETLIREELPIFKSIKRQLLRHAQMTENEAMLYIVENYGQQVGDYVRRLYDVQPKTANYNLQDRNNEDSDAKRG